MRPRLFSYTFAALDADGYVASANVNSVAVGAAYTIRSSATHPNDGASHPVTVYSAGDTTGTVFTVTGTDAEGRSISEDITGPNAGTSTSTKYFADVTSVVRKSGATGAVAFTVGYSAAAKTPIIPMSPYTSTTGGRVGIDVGGTVDLTAQETNGNVFTTDGDSLLFTAVSADLTGFTTDKSGQLAIGTTGFRVLVNSHTSGTISITLTQPTGV